MTAVEDSQEAAAAVPSSSNASEAGASSTSSAATNVDDQQAAAVATAASGGSTSSSSGGVGAVTGRGGTNKPFSEQEQQLLLKAERLFYAKRYTGNCHTFSQFGEMVHAFRHIYLIVERKRQQTKSMRQTGAAVARLLQRPRGEQ